MKTLKNHILIYDSECPMCTMYSKGFIKAGMLDENGRKAFTEVSSERDSLIDFNRAKNEIALVDYRQSKVIYGLDSLLLIIGNSFPALEKMARIQPLYWFFKKLYSFVSYNRKQIIPSEKDHNGQGCVPDFNVRYRLAYISFVVIFSAFVLSLFSAQMNVGLKVNFWREFAVCAVQIAWQTLFLKNYLKEKCWDYIGNMMTVSLIGTLLLIPALLLNLNGGLLVFYFGFVVVLMFLEHLRRCKILQLNLLPTVSWTIFRMTVAALIIGLNF